MRGRYLEPMSKWLSDTTTSLPSNIIVSQVRQEMIISTAVKQLETVSGAFIAKIKKIAPHCPQGYFRGGFFPKMVETLQLLYQADICSLTVYLVRPQREGERGRERAALFPAYIHPSPPPPPSPSIFIYQFSELRRRPFPIASEPPFEFGHQNRTAHFHT